MKELPLYLPGKSLWEGGLAVAVDGEPPRDLDPSCRRCTLWKSCRSVCIAADGEPGGILLVGEKPGVAEDAVGRPHVGQTGAYLREQVDRWAGTTPIAYTNAVNCAPGAKEVTPSMVAACRGYLAGTIRDARPARIICLGAIGAQAVLGRSTQPLSVRRGVAWTASGVPVFLVMHNAHALRNRLLRLAFEDDLAWAMTAAPPFPSPANATYCVVETVEDAERAVEVLTSVGRFAYDCEWVGRPYGREGFQLSNIAAAPCPDFVPAYEKAYVWDAWALRDARAEPLKRLLCDGHVMKVGSNLASDMHAVERGLNTRVRGADADVRLMRKLIEADADGELAVMAELVGMGGHKLEADAVVKDVAAALRAELRARLKEKSNGQRRMFAGERAFPHVPRDVEDTAFRVAAATGEEGREGKGRGFSIALLPLDVGNRYNARDALVTARLYAWAKARLKDDEPIRRVWEGITREAMVAVQRVEAWGIAVDGIAVKVVQAHLDSLLAPVDARLASYVPKEFNWDSPKQVADLFYNQLKIAVPKINEDSNNPSVDEEALEAMRGRHPAIDDLLEHRRLVKLRSTYADGLEKALGVDGRVHGYILLDGAGTGRSSMQDPNLQNVPRASSVEGKLIRQCFVAPAGKLLVEFDYSTLEPRVAAILSGDPVLRQLFIDHRDFHGETAQIIKPFLWPTAPAVTKLMRQDSKPVGLGVMYGKTVPALAETLGCARRVAQQVLDAILGKYRVLAKWIRESIAFAQTHGYMQTWWAGAPARRRPLWSIASHDKGQQGNAERGSYNGRIQGTASDFLIRSLTEVVRLIEEEALPALLLLPVHDSLLLEVPIADVEEVVDAVTRVMLSWDSAGVPLEVEVKVGANWGELVDLAEWRKQQAATNFARPAQVGTR